MKKNNVGHPPLGLKAKGKIINLYADDRSKLAKVLKVLDLKFSPFIRGLINQEYTRLIKANKIKSGVRLRKK